MCDCKQVVVDALIDVATQLECVGRTGIRLDDVLRTIATTIKMAPTPVDNSTHAELDQQVLVAVLYDVANELERTCDDAIHRAIEDTLRAIATRLKDSIDNSPHAGRIPTCEGSV